MNQQIENAIGRIADDARKRYGDLLRGARQTTQQAAGKVSRGKKPLKTISRLGLKLTAVTHRTADKVLKQNTKLVEHQIDAVAERLKAAAGARDLRDLVGSQIRLVSENANRIAGDARESLRIVAGAGGEVREILARTAQELRGGNGTVRRPARKNAARPAARKTKKKATTAPKSPTTGEAPAGAA